MIQIKVTCDGCAIYQNKTVDYRELSAVRGLIDQHFTRLQDMSLCNTCMDAYRADREEIELRFKAELDALMADLLTP